MRYNRDVHRRRSIRLRGFDYSQPGAYFITVCTHQRAPLFGDVVNGAMVLNAAGVIVDTVWRDMPNHFPLVALGEYVVMPNHFHGIVHIVGEKPVGAPLVGALDAMGNVMGAPTRGAPTVGNVVGTFKSLATNAYIDGVNRADWPPFHGRLWQRNYYENIIRNEQAYAAIADYIYHNPQRWHDDVYCCG